MYGSVYMYVRDSISYITHTHTHARTQAHTHTHTHLAGIVSSELVFNNVEQAEIVHVLILFAKGFKRILIHCNSP